MTKTIIVTGASSGIGKALSLHLAKLGHTVIAIGRNKKSLEELKAQEPKNITPIVADITINTEREKIIQALPKNITGVCLVHNAGIANPVVLKEMTEEEWDQHYLVNTKAPLFLTKVLLPYLSNGGRVLHISTNLAHKAMPGFAAYGISKAAFYMTKEFCNSELLENDIAFGSAMPGIVDTPIQEHIRSVSTNRFPNVGLFQGFKSHDELLNPSTAAKFLTWVLLETDKNDFVKGEWDIYSAEHHKFWAEPNEIKSREEKKLSLK